MEKAKDNTSLHRFITEYTTNKHIMMHFIGQFREPTLPDEQYSHLLNKRAKMITVGGNVMKVEILETKERFDLDLTIDKWSVMDIE